MLLWGGWYLVQAFASSSWPTVEGTVKAVRVHTESTGSGHTRRVSYRYSVEYAYEVGGQAYTSDKHAMGSGNTAGRAGTRTEARREGRERFPTGKAVRVYYDPDDPAVAVLQPGASLDNWGAYMPVVLGLLFAVLGGWILWLVKSRRTVARPTT
jgi:hypothetical protein